jgi:hypothetical protein
MKLVKQIFKYSSKLPASNFLSQTLLTNDFRTYIYGRQIDNQIFWEEDVQHYIPCSEIEDADPKELLQIRTNRKVQIGEMEYIGNDSFPSIRDANGCLWIFKDNTFFKVDSKDWIIL